MAKKKAIATTRAAIYARVSTRDKGQDTANQLDQLREYAARQGWEITAEYTDQESAATRERPQFQAMWAAAARRSFDVLLFWSLDRLSRGGAFETLTDLNRLAGYGIKYKSLTELYLDTCGIFGEAVVGILATIAKQERLRLSERTRAGLERARKEGKQIGRPPADTERIREMAARNVPAAIIARDLKLHRTTVWRALGGRPSLDQQSGG